MHKLQNVGTRLLLEFHKAAALTSGSSLTVYFINLLGVPATGITPFFIWLAANKAVVKIRALCTTQEGYVYTTASCKGNRDSNKIPSSSSSSLCQLYKAITKIQI